MNIAVIGAGYVGLVSGACFAQAGQQVTCVDVDSSKVDELNRGEVPIYEPGLAELIAPARRKGTLRFSRDARGIAARADVIFLAVGTPARDSDGDPDLSFLHAAITEIAPALRDGCLIVTKSTVPVGTGDEIQRMIKALRPDLDFEVASNPEFLRAGCAIDDFRYPDRVVIGAQSETARATLRGLYADLGIDPRRIVVTQRRSAELIKYAANGFLATKIAFINEIADLCESVDAEVDEVALGMGLDSRIGHQFLNAGPGFGGSCFPKDAKALAKTGEDHGTPMRIIQAVLDSNGKRKQSMARKIAAMLGGNPRGKTVVLLGLTFKAGTDDMRGAPSIDLAHALVDAGANVNAYDPIATERAEPLLPPSVTYHTTVLAAARGAHLAVVLTEWDQFRTLDFESLKNAMRTPLLLDLRNMLPKEQMIRHGFHYRGIGGGEASLARNVATLASDNRRNRSPRFAAGTRVARALRHDIIAAE
jgi:UDPglucose 6-dehydrogenase